MRHVEKKNMMKMEVVSGKISKACKREGAQGRWISRVLGGKHFHECCY